MDLTLYLAAAGAGVVTAAMYESSRRRTKQIRSLAAELGFVYIGSALPHSVDLKGTGVEGVSAVWNAIDGEHQGTRVVAFDCRIGSGKGSLRRTVIAARSSNNIFASFGGYGTNVERSEPWQVRYEPRSSDFLQGLTPVPELAAQLKSLY